MQSLDDDERKQVLGEVLADELKAIREYVEDVPAIKRQLHQVNTTVNEVNERLIVLEQVVKSQEEDLTGLKRKAA